MRAVVARTEQCADDISARVSLNGLSTLGRVQLGVDTSRSFRNYFALSAGLYIELRCGDSERLLLRH